MAPAPWRIAGKHPGQTVLPPRENSTLPLWAGRARCTSAKATTKPWELGKHPGGMMLQGHSTPREYPSTACWRWTPGWTDHHMIRDGCSHPPKFPSGDDHFLTQTHNLATLALSTELGREKNLKVKNKAYFLSAGQGANKSLFPASHPSAKLHPVLGALTLN